VEAHENEKNAACYTATPEWFHPAAALAVDEELYPEGPLPVPSYTDPAQGYGADESPDGSGLWEAP
jgi:hypothetical protein